MEFVVNQVSINNYTTQIWMIIIATAIAFTVMILWAWLPQHFIHRWVPKEEHFKREFTYSDVYLVWETIRSSSQVSSSHFYLFVALGLVENYRDIILDRNMDFTDIIKFFNEMADKHEDKQILAIAREMVLKLQTMIIDE